MEEAGDNVGGLRSGGDSIVMGSVRVADSTGRGYDQRSDCPLERRVDGDSVHVRGAHGAFLLAGQTSMERGMSEVWDQVDGADCFI